MHSRVKTGLAIGFAALVGYLTLWPVSIDPIAWTPPAPPEATGALAENHALAKAERLGAGQLDGPEDVAVDADGRMFVGTHDGRIAIVSPDGASITTLVETPGRALGLAWDREGNLLAADTEAGLLKIAPDGTTTILTASSQGVRFGFADDVDVGSDGRIYFTDASDKFGYGHHLEDLLEARPHGRLLRYDPSTEQTETLLDGLHFANGVAVAADDAYVLVNETGRFRVTRYWLTGPNAGTSEPFADIPGYPDGISRSPRGTYWVAVANPRNEQADNLAPHPFLTKVVWRLPAFLRPKPSPFGLVIELDATGEVLRALYDPDGGQISFVTSVEEVDGHLYLGSLTEAYVGRLKLDPL